MVHEVYQALVYGNEVLQEPRISHRLVLLVWVLKTMLTVSTFSFLPASNVDFEQRLSRRVRVEPREG